MRCATVCSGICVPTLSWKPKGWQTLFFSEINPFASAVLNHYYPEVPNLGDMNNLFSDEHFKQYKKQPIDLVFGGTPCQSFSLAGLRKGLDDPRGNLALVFLKVIDELRPRWVVWENVPGVLSSNEGRDFGAFVGGLGKLGYGFAYRVLDAQYFGVPQRRRRVFLVGYIGSWQYPAAVLFERYSLSRNIEPSRKEGIQITHSTSPTLRANGIGGKIGNQAGMDPIVPAVYPTIQTRLNAVNDQDFKNGCYLPAVFQPRMARNGRGQLSFDVPTITTDNLRAGSDATNLLAYNSIRRITPKEAERLQGLPDDFTKIPYRGRSAEMCADQPRYQAIGNSIAKPVMDWVVYQIDAVNQIINSHANKLQRVPAKLENRNSASNSEKIRR